MPRAERLAELGLRDVPHEEEQKAFKEFVKDLRKRKWKKIEIEAAEAGWEWAFDTGYDQPHLDSDAAGDLADCVIDGNKRHNRGAIADCVYEGVNAARSLQDPVSPAEREREKQERIAQHRKELGR